MKPRSTAGIPSTSSPRRVWAQHPCCCHPAPLAFCSDLAFHLLLHPRKSIRDKPKLTLSQEKYFCASYSEVDCMAGTSTQMKSYRHPLVHPAPIPQKTKQFPKTNDSLMAIFTSFISDLQSRELSCRRYSACKLKPGQRPKPSTKGSLHIPYHDLHIILGSMRPSGLAHGSRQGKLTAEILQGATDGNEMENCNANQNTTALFLSATFSERQNR